MRILRITVALLLTAACAHQPSVAPGANKTAPPQTAAKAVTEVIHGTTISDPYRWLEDQQSPETREWIDRQNAYTDSILGNRPEKKRFAKRLEKLLTTDQMSTPIVRGGRYFFTKRAAGQDLFAIYMREGPAGPDLLLIDPAPMSPKHTTNVGIEDVSNDGKYLGYYIRQGGADEVEVRVFDIDRRHDIGVALPLARYFGVSMTPDNKTLYFTRFEKEGSRVYRRGVSGGGEEKLFGDGYGPEKIIGSSLSDDGAYLQLTVFYGSAGRKTELYLKNVATDGPIQTVTRDLDARSTADLAGDTLVIETNWNASNERVMVVSAADPGREKWRELIPERKDAAIQSVSLAGGRIFVRYLENVRPRILAFGLDGGAQGEIHFDEIGSLADVSGTWRSPVAFYRFNSFHIPPTIYAYDVPSGKGSIFFRQSEPVKSENFTVEQVWYPSKDGTRIPMFLMYKKGLQKDGKNPAYLTGYGGFNASQLPNFSSNAVAWAENGGVYGLANLRGGGEFGEEWHRAGMLDKKQNVFDDFTAAAEYLVREHYTSPEHLGIAGGSNGGLLVTAFTTQRPDLVKAVVCSYPLIDMLRYDKFLVGRFWVPEYGSADDPEQFSYIYAYSPYQHVVKGTKYPAILFITGDADTRVAPLHARKMAALMQASTGSNNPVLLRYHVSSGHSGGEPLRVQINNSSETLSFLAWQLK